jgi:hypothetical protein
LIAKAFEEREDTRAVQVAVEQPTGADDGAPRSRRPERPASLDLDPEPTRCSWFDGPGENSRTLFSWCGKPNSDHDTQWESWRAWVVRRFPDVGTKKQKEENHGKRMARCAPPDCPDCKAAIVRADRIVWPAWTRTSQRRQTELPQPSEGAGSEASAPASS